MVLAVGVMAGFITISMHREMYDTTGSNSPDLQVREWPIVEPENEDTPNRKGRHLEPIYGMCLQRG